nr:uncharacterized protein LOC121825012 isoform X3 [Peromyscus maniculatus bairdii]
MVTSDTSQSPGAEARSCTGPLGGYGAAPEDTSPPLPLQDPTRGAETMRRRRLSEAAGPHLLHRVSAPPSLTLAGWQAGEGEGEWSQPASWKNPRDDWSCSRPIFETHNWKLGLLSRTQRFLKSEGT